MMVMDKAELSVTYSGGWAVVPPSMPPRIGQRSEAPRVISERYSASNGGTDYEVVLEGLAGRTYTFIVKTPSGDRKETVTFPTTGANADGYSVGGLRIITGTGPG